MALIRPDIPTGTGDAGGVSFSLPSGTQIGDILLFFVGKELTSGVTANVGTWTHFQNSAVGVGMWARVDSAIMTAGSITFTWGGTRSYCAALTCVYEVHPTDGPDQIFTGSLPSGTITPDSVDDLMFIYYGMGNDNNGSFNVSGALSSDQYLNMTTTAGDDSGLSALWARSNVATTLTANNTGAASEAGAGFRIKTVPVVDASPMMHHMAAVGGLM